jgi:hypothetical protein
MLTIISKGAVIPAYVVNTHRTMEVYLHTFLVLALDGAEWSALCLGCFGPQGGAPGTH